MIKHDNFTCTWERSELLTRHWLCLTRLSDNLSVVRLEPSFGLRPFVNKISFAVVILGRNFKMGSFQNSRVRKNWLLLQDEKALFIQELNPTLNTNLTLIVNLLQLKGQFLISKCAGKKWLKHFHVTFSLHFPTFLKLLVTGYLKVLGLYCYPPYSKVAANNLFFCLHVN